MTRPAFSADNVFRSAKILADRANGRKPRLALLLGSGMGPIADTLEDPVTVSYHDLPGFPIPGVAGHAGEIVFGRLAGTEILCLKGRKHTYETNDFSALKTLVRTVKAFGCDTLFLTSASGSLRDDMPPGHLMVMSDHINFMGVNPLVGDNDDDFGPRFPPMTDAWDPTLRHHYRAAAEKAGVAFHEGVYMGFRGPSFETPAEIRMAQKMGADACGMSAVPECIIARHCDLRVIGCAIITNMAAGLSNEEISHAHTLEQAKKAYGSFEKLISQFLAEALP